MEKERRNLLDDPTGIEDNAKQEALDKIRFNIENMLVGGDQFTSVDEIVYDINLKDINEYMNFLVKDETLPTKLTRIRSYNVDNLDLFEQLCDYTSVNNSETPRLWNQKVYFIESGYFALTFIPIALEDKKSVNIYMEPLETSPDLITELWARLNEEKNLEDIDFVDYRDLL